MKTIAHRINEGLRMRHMKQADLAKLTGINKSAISSYVSGAYEPKQKNIYLIAKALNVNEAWLMGHDVSCNRENKQSVDIGGTVDSYIHTTGAVPVIDGIAAGAPVLAEENIIDYIPVTVRNPEEYFALVVRGDSMINAGIPDGAKVLIHMQPGADDGQIVACRVNGTDATLKRFKLIGDSAVLLLPENPVYEPIVVQAEDFHRGDAEIIGVVKQIIIDV